MRGERESWDGAGDGSWLRQDAPIEFGGFEGFGMGGVFLRKKKNQHLERRFTNHKVEEEVCKQRVSWRVEQRL